MDITEVRMLDVARPDAIEVEVSEDGTTMWVHVNGVTLLRASHIGRLFITDHRNQELAARRETDQIQLDYIAEEKLERERRERHRTPGAHPLPGKR